MTDDIFSKDHVWKLKASTKHDDSIVFIVAIGLMRMGDLSIWEPSVTYKEKDSWDYYTIDKDMFLRDFEPFRGIVYPRRCLYCNEIFDSKNLPKSCPYCNAEIRY